MTTTLPAFELPPPHPGMTAIESAVARGMDLHEFSYTFNQESHQIPGLFYRVDFWIRGQPKPPAWLELPAYVEVKPQEFIYYFRDALGVTRQAGERFRGAVELPISANQIIALDCGTRGWAWEFSKPKKLAEMTGESVLICATSDGTETLSVTMTPTSAVFRRDHPFVNQSGVRRQQERERKAEERRLHWEQVERDRQRERAAKLHHYRQLAARSTRRNGHPGPCLGCSIWVQPGGGALVNLAQPGEATRWGVVGRCCTG